MNKCMLHDKEYVGKSSECMECVDLTYGKGELITKQKVIDILKKELSKYRPDYLDNTKCIYLDLVKKFNLEKEMEGEVDG